MHNLILDSLTTVKPKFIIGGGVADNNQYSGSNQEKAIFDFTYSGEQKEATANATKFYPDQLTTGNMADKKVIFEKSGINETQQLDEQLLEEINEVICESMALGTQISTLFFDHNQHKKIIGNIHYVDELNQKIRVISKEGRAFQIPFNSIIKVDLNKT